MAEPEVRVTEYEVSVLPRDDMNNSTWAVKVEYRGNGLWAVTRPHRCLSKGGKWDFEPLPSSRTDAWLRRHRFDLDEALRLAKVAAPDVTVNGWKASDLARDKASRAGAET